jgi:Kef-type K+ transport system membrane component KefB
VERFSIVVPALLPLFFAYVGVRTQLTLLSDVSSVLVCIGVVIVATLGKLGGSAFAARATGMTWREALTIGALMNTRGLMELVALNIGYDLGILTPAIFAILVVMALVTTMLTGPLLTVFGRGLRVSSV